MGAGFLRFSHSVLWPSGSRTQRPAQRERDTVKMRSFEIFVAPDPTALGHSGSRGPDGSISQERGVPASGIQLRERRHRVREVLDVFVDGANVTARVAESHASCVLRDLGLALTELSRAPRGKAIVRFYDDAWELCIERLGAIAMLSVYRAGSEPSVAVYDRSVVFDDVVESAREAIDAALLRGSASRVVALELRDAGNALREARPALPVDDDLPPVPAPAPVVIEIDRDAPIGFAAEFSMRAGPLGSSGGHREASMEGKAAYPVERADLHALLFRGRMRAEIRGRAIDLGEGHPFLFAERLFDLSRRTLDSWERGQACNVRCEAGGLLVGVRLSADGALALTLGGGRRGGEHSTATFPALSVADVVEAALAFGRALIRGILRRDRSQCTNLRLSGFRRQLRETADLLREACREDAKINPTPEPYRAFALNVAARPAATNAAPIATGRLRYTSRWRAIVPGIDLRATFLCGDRLVVGAAQETFCLDRTSGEVLWRAPTERATSVVTPGGIARLHPDGALFLHDFGTGEVTLHAWVAPRLGGAPAGAVVHVPGLPRLLIVTEGERHLVAIDLTSGEPRWRFAWGSRPKGSAAWGGATMGAPSETTPGAKRGALRMKRAGKLLYFTSGDSALTALDVLTGAVVWRLRDRLRFRSAPTLDHDQLFAVAGGVSCATRLHAVDPFSGRARWAQAVSDGWAPACTVEGSPLASGSVVAVAVRDRQGLRLVAFDRETGAPRWSSKGTVAPIGTSWLVVDGLIIGNTPTGELLALDAEKGELRYRHVLGRMLESDTPRRLEPVLRSGALFVPHSDVHVFRPGDGALLGTIAPCDAIPDLLRVDERCDVYVAEESGHLACFGAGPRLSLVR